MKKILSSIVVLLMFSSQAYAGFKYVGHANVKRYYPKGGVTYVQMSNTHINPAGCKVSGYYAFNKETIAEADEYRKLLLTAKVSNIKLGVYIHDDKCLGSYPQLYSMFIQ